MEDEIKVSQTATLTEFVESFRKSSLLKNPKLMKISVTFRDDNGQTEERSLKHKTYEEDETIVDAPASGFKKCPRCGHYSLREDGRCDNGCYSEEI